MVALGNRFNTLLLLLLVLMAGAIITMLATRAHGGPLDPTSAPAPTDGIRGPGTPISSLPFVIDASGYYYVTRPLTGQPGGNGISINVSNVTVDLGGFSVGGGPVPGDGIFITLVRNVTIRNGALRGWTAGINATAATDSRIVGVQASSNMVGISIGAHSDISDCNASLNTNAGIVASSAVVRHCTASENGQAGILAGESLVEDNKVQNNSNNNASGIELNGNRSTLRDNELSSNFLDVKIDASADHNVLIGNVVCSVTDAGTNTQSPSGNIVRC